MPKKSYLAFLWYSMKHYGIYEGIRAVDESEVGMIFATYLSQDAPVAEANILMGYSAEGGYAVYADAVDGVHPCFTSTGETDHDVAVFPHSFG